MEVMFLVQIYFKSTLKEDFFLRLKNISNFEAFPEIQDGGQKEIMRGKFKFRFSKWKLPFYPCYHAFLWCNISV